MCLSVFVIYFKLSVCIYSASHRLMLLVLHYNPLMIRATEKLFIHKHSLICTRIHISLFFVFPRLYSTDKWMQTKCLPKISRKKSTHNKSYGLYLYALICVFNNWVSLEANLCNEMNKIKIKTKRRSCYCCVCVCIIICIQNGYLIIVIINEKNENPSLNSSKQCVFSTADDNRLIF